MASRLLLIALIVLCSVGLSKIIDDALIEEYRLGADATYALYPSADCASKLRVCYQGDEDVLKSQILNIDPFFTCKSNFVLKESSCSLEGFELGLGKDPIFTKTTIWVHSPFDNSLLLETPAATLVEAPDASKAPAASNKFQPPRVDPSLPHSAYAALDALLGPFRQSKKPKFVESVDVYLDTSLEPHKQNSSIRTLCALPHGTGKLIKVAIFTEDYEEAQTALKDPACVAAGGSVLIKEIESKGLSALNGAEKCIANASAMPFMKPLARVLGPRGMMPNKKNGSLVEEVLKALETLKSGAVEMRTDRQGRLAGSIGRADFPYENLIDNLRSFLVTAHQNRPSGAPKGSLVKRAALSTTMGKFVELRKEDFDPKNARFLAKDLDELEAIREFNSI